MPYDRMVSGQLRLDPPPEFRRNLLSSALTVYQGVELARVIRVTKYGPVPELSSELSGRYVACIWRVTSTSRRFKPEDVFNDSTGI